MLRLKLADNVFAFIVAINKNRKSFFSNTLFSFLFVFFLFSPVNIVFFLLMLTCILTTYASVSLPCIWALIIYFAYIRYDKKPEGNQMRSEVIYYFNYLWYDVRSSDYHMRTDILSFLGFALNCVWWGDKNSWYLLSSVWLKMTKQRENNPVGNYICYILWQPQHSDHPLLSDQWQWWIRYHNLLRLAIFFCSTQYQTQRSYYRWRHVCSNKQ